MLAAAVGLTAAAECTRDTLSTQRIEDKERLGAVYQESSQMLVLGC